MSLPQVKPILQYNLPNKTLQNDKIKPQPHFSHFTRGSNDNCHYEVIHSSKNKIEKINKFMCSYETSGRNVPPEVLLNSYASRILTGKNAKN